MDGFYWVVHDGNGREVQVTERFPSRQEAEDFMSEHWQELLDSGGDSASLHRDGDVLYRMGLGPG